jgi:hypothetical protein
MVEFNPNFGSSYFLGGPDPEAGGFLTEEVLAPIPPSGQLTIKEREEDLEYTTGLTKVELEGLTDSNAIAFGPITERKLAPFNSISILESLIDNGATLEELQAANTKKQEIDKALNRVEELTSVDLTLARDPTASGSLFRIEHRSGIARKILLDKAEEFKDGFGGSVLELIDQMAYDTYAGMRDVVSSVSGEGTEITDVASQWEVALRSYSDEEFDTFVRQRLETIEGGLLSGKEPAWRVIRELEAMESAGIILWDEEMGVLAGAMSALDLVTVGTIGVKAISKTGRSLIGRLKGVAGTRVTTEAAIGTNLVVRETGRHCSFSGCFSGSSYFY